GFEGDGLMQRALFTFRSVVFFDPEHPVSDHDLEAYCTRPHARVMLGSDSGFEIDRKLAKMGRSRHVAVQAGDFDSVLRFVRGSRLIATLPSFLVRFAGRELAHCEMPLPAREYTLMLYWHARHQHTARHRFWRDCIVGAAESYKA
ncbi:MAG: LysR substrate-binding domain-containing protein, partial [Pseudomonadota bacterium]